MTCTLCGSTQHTAPNCKWLNTCLLCEHVEVKGLPKGFGTCRPYKQPQGASRSITTTKECGKRKSASAAVVEKRVAWIEGRP